MTHEKSDPSEYSDYLPRVLAPATPLMVLGRSKSATPPCKAEECLWYAWKDRCAWSLCSCLFHNIPK